MWQHQGPCLQRLVINNNKKMLQKWTLKKNEGARKFSSPLSSSYRHFSSVPTVIFLFSSSRADCVHTSLPSSFLRLQLNTALSFWELSLKRSTCIFPYPLGKEKKMRHEEEKGGFWLYILFPVFFLKRYSCLEHHSLEFLLWGLHSTTFDGEGPPENP